MTLQNAVLRSWLVNIKMGTITFIILGFFSSQILCADNGTLKDVAVHSKTISKHLK